MTSRSSMPAQKLVEASAPQSIFRPSSTATSIKHPDFEKLTQHPVLSRICRELGWQVFGNQNVPQLSPIVERQLAGVKVIEHHLGPSAGRRLVGTASNGFFVVVHVIEGSEWVYGPRGAHRLRAGDIATWHTSQEVAFEVESSVHKISYIFSETDSRSPLCPPPELCDNSVPRESALGAMMSGLFGGLSTQLDAMPPRYHALAMAAARDFATRAILVEAAGTENVLNNAAFERVIRYIDRHFDQPTLTPTRLASVHGISLRYLHLLFAQRGHTVSSWIRERRLEYCCQVLANAHPSLGVSEIAFRAGFKDSSHFSRAFRQRFGVSPTEHRRKSQAPPPAPGMSPHGLY